MHTLNEYRRRMEIEEAFLDDKSGGFQLEDSLVPDADSVSRLLLVMAITALYWFCSAPWSLNATTVTPSIPIGAAA